MSKITGNDSAMPFQSSELSVMNEAHYGLTIRQYFAGLAMQGIMANPKSLKNAERFMANLPSDMSDTDKAKNVDAGFAHFAVNVTDALIAELNKEK